MRYVALVPLVLLLLFLFGANGPPERVYIGAERCRLCHRAVYDAWSSTDHPKATDRLAPSDREPGCLVCHATGPSALPGVQCEACHGPGGDYWRPEVMLDSEKARAAGLIEPKESVCRSCHGIGLRDHSSSFFMPREADWPRVIH